MTSQSAASKLVAVILSAALVVAGLVYVAVAAFPAEALVSSRSSAPAAMAQNVVDPSRLGRVPASDNSRRLQPAAVTDVVTFIYNKSGVKCDKQDRLFRKSGKSLYSCFELCNKTADCNHFGFVLRGKHAGRCRGCRHGWTTRRQPYTFFTLVRPVPVDSTDAEPTFSCPGFDFRTESQQAEIMSLCGTPTSTSTSTSTRSTSSLSASSSSSTSTTTSSTTSSSSTSTSSSSTSSSSSTTTSSSTTSSSSSTTTTTQKIFVPQDYRELRRAVGLWSSDREQAFDEYGHISLWSTSLITDMSWLFRYWTFLDDEDISGWDVSNVEDMRSMFEGSNFNQDISAWDVSKVRNMMHMFWGALAFNQDISAWNVGKVENMEGMFSVAKAFNQDISRWDVSSVSGYEFTFAGVFIVGFRGGMSYMFSGAEAFNHNISGWDVSNVLSMSFMFENAKSFNQDLSRWNVSRVGDMSFIFSGAEAFDMDISGWDVSSVINMERAFQDAKSFNQDISGWDVSRVGECLIQCGMDRMFYGAEAFNDSDISIWTPTSLKSSPSKFMSCSAAVFRYGDWSSWGSKVPNCY